MDGFTWNIRRHITSWWYRGRRRGNNISDKITEGSNQTEGRKDQRLGERTEGRSVSMEGRFDSTSEGSSTASRESSSSDRQYGEDCRPLTRTEKNVRNISREFYIDTCKRLDKTNVKLNSILKA